MKGIKILLTFDYELPLGTCEDYQKALFQPTENLIKCANSLDVPIVLFADICSVIRFKEWDFDNYYVPFSSQLKKSIRDGHDVQLHIHPHWMNSTYLDGKFVPSTYFSLSSFKDSPSGFSIEKIIERSFAELIKIGKEASSDYNALAFRAGGYDVEPESKRILNKLYELGIRIESSVIKDLYLDYSFSHIDYSSTPNQSNWFISKNGPLTKLGNNDLVELPISSMPISFPNILRRRLKKTLNKDRYRQRVVPVSGKGFLAMSGNQTIKSKLRKITNPQVLSFDKEHLEYEDLASILTYNFDKYKSESGDLILTAIGHPKSMGQYHLNLLQEFVEKTRLKYQDQVEFVTYPKILESYKTLLHA
ncbi:MAG: hypothetical protein JJE09_00960 [Bacteroidia bacterium]|nr:hypothetical protein [Bacteroidia bacterium]